MCLTGKSQNVPKHLMSTNKFNYNGWKIKKGSVIHLTNSDSFYVREMKCYSVRGENMVNMYTNISGRDTVINFNYWVNDDLIVLPKGVAKIPIINTQPPIEVSTQKDIVEGYEPSLAMQKAGFNLMQAATVSRTGNNLMLIGTLGTLAGAGFAISGDPEIGAIASVGSGVLTLVGFIVRMSSDRYISNAGQYLQGVVPLKRGKAKKVYKDF